jgi:hypothetical protein
MDEQRRDRRWAWGVAALALVLTCIPLLYGFWQEGTRADHGWFTTFTYNGPDHAVYLSWMRQASEGRFFEQNQFTTEPQLGLKFNLFWLAVGGLAGLLHLPLLVACHVARLVMGLVFLRVLWWFLEETLTRSPVRRAAYLMACFASGLGWLFWVWPNESTGLSVDLWQPEAITFLCLYWSAFYPVALALMVGLLGFLWKAEQTGSWRYAACAGGCGLLLGNIHTYDVLAAGSAWTLFLLGRGVFHGRWDKGAWGRACLAGALTAVSTAYTAWLLLADPVFQKRAAVPTLAPSPHIYLLGFGLPLVLAVAALVLLARPRARGEGLAGQVSSALRENAALLLGGWMVVNVALAYLPVTFQRKLIMGAHIPMAILAGVLFCVLVQRWTDWRRTLLLSLAVPALVLSHVVFFNHTAETLTRNRSPKGPERWYLYTGERDALRWIEAHAEPGAVIQPIPWVHIDEGKLSALDMTLAVLTPGLTGHAVDMGHRGETPDCGSRAALWLRFLDARVSDEWRKDLLRRSGVRYIIFSQKHDETGDPRIEAGFLAAFRLAAPAFLKHVVEASNADADVYEVPPEAGR